MALYVDVATLTKGELTRLLGDLPDDAKVYVMASRQAVRLAMSAATVGPGDAYFGLSKSLTRELDGVALVADVRPAASKVGP